MAGSALPNLEVFTPYLDTGSHVMNLGSRTWIQGKSGVILSQEVRFVGENLINAEAIAEAEGRKRVDPNVHNILEEAAGLGVKAVDISNRLEVLSKEAIVKGEVAMGLGLKAILACTSDPPNEMEAAAASSAAGDYLVTIEDEWKALKALTAEAENIQLASLTVTYFKRDIIG